MEIDQNPCRTGKEVGQRKEGKEKMEKLLNME
jgi:hypothetical protein